MSSPAILGQTSGDILSWDNATFKNYGNIEEQGKEATNYFLFTEIFKQDFKSLKMGLFSNDNC